MLAQEQPLTAGMPSIAEALSLQSPVFFLFFSNFVHDSHLNARLIKKVLFKEV